MEPASSKKGQTLSESGLSYQFLRNYLADDDEAAPLPPVELDAPEPEGEGDDEEDDDDPEPEAGAGVVEDAEDEPPGTTTISFSFVTSLLLVEPLPLEPGATTAVSFCSLHALSASALSRTNIHVPCFLVIFSPWVSYNRWQAKDVTGTQDIVNGGCARAPVSTRRSPECRCTNLEWRRGRQTPPAWHCRAGRGRVRDHAAARAGVTPERNTECTKS